MCNACGFTCCAMDCMERCGCEDCENPLCWEPEEEEDIDADDDEYEDYY